MKTPVHQILFFYILCCLPVSGRGQDSPEAAGIFIYPKWEVGGNKTYKILSTISAEDERTDINITKEYEIDISVISNDADSYNL